MGNATLAMLAAIDPTFVLSNRIEAALWGAIAAAMLIAAMRQCGGARLDCILASIAFATFGLSDIVETTTGAWWRPWWLLAWKGACLFAFLILLARHLKRKRLPR